MERWMEEDADPSRAVALVMIPSKRRVEMLFVIMPMLLLVVVFMYLDSTLDVSIGDIMSNGQDEIILGLEPTQLTWSWRSVCAPASITSVDSATSPPYLYLSFRVEWYHTIAMLEKMFMLFVKYVLFMYIFIYRRLLEMYIRDAMSLAEKRLEGCGRSNSSLACLALW